MHQLMTATNPCESAGWPSLQAALDKVPVFTIANGEGQPLQYQVGDRKLAIMYADVVAATKESVTAREQYPDLGSDIVPVGLGVAYKLASSGEAMVVPGMAELLAAGAPEGAQPMGQELPLFACMQLKRESEEGPPKVPLFMSYSDCAAAVAQAIEADAPKEPFEVDAVLSLQSVVEELTTLADPSSGEFAFQAPSASLQHLESYVGSGVYMRKVDDKEED